LSRKLMSLKLIIYFY